MDRCWIFQVLDAADSSLVTDYLGINIGRIDIWVQRHVCRSSILVAFFVSINK